MNKKALRARSRALPSASGFASSSNAELSKPNEPHKPIEPTRLQRAAAAARRCNDLWFLRAVRWMLAGFVAFGGGALLAVSGAASFVAPVAVAASAPPAKPLSKAERLGTAFSYDEGGDLIFEQGTGGPTSTGTTIHVSLPTPSGPMPVAMVANGAKYAVHSDQFNTPRRVTNAQGQPVWQMAYSAFGEDKPTLAANRFANLDTTPNPGKTGTPEFTMNKRGAGQHDDKESGLFHNWHRDYSASLGRFTQADPSGLAGGWNPYPAVESNPLQFIDPEGLQTRGIREPVIPFEGNRAGGGTIGGNGAGSGFGGGGAGAGRGVVMPVCPPIRQSTLVDRATEREIGRVVVDSRGNAMIEPMADGRWQQEGRESIRTLSIRMGRTISA